MGLPLILIDQIPLNLLQQLELLSLNLVALAQLVGNPLQPIFKAIQATYTGARYQVANKRWRFTE